MKLKIEISFDVIINEDFYSKTQIMNELDIIKSKLKEDIIFKFQEQKINSIDLTNRQIDITFY
jgi:hypothetical protein